MQPRQSRDNDTGSKDDNQTAASYLVSLSQLLISLLNSRAYDDPFFTEKVSPDVFVDLQGHKTTGLEGFFQNYKKDADAVPTFHVDIVNSTAEVEQKKGRATVILSQDLKGYGGPEKKAAGTILMSWQKRPGQEQWICASVCMMLGTPEFLV